MTEREKDARKMESRIIELREIAVAGRIRTEQGNIAELAESIRARGLLNPITVMERAEGGYLLIAGLRRMEAARFLGETTIRASVVSPVEADEMLMMEVDENEQRKEFTMDERRAFRDRIQEIEVEKARRRRNSNLKNVGIVVGHGPQREGEANSISDAGRSREIIAKKAGFSSARQMKRVDEIAEKRPDLLPLIDAKKLSVRHAHDIAVGKIGETAAKKSGDGFISEEPVEIEAYPSYKPFLEPAPGRVSTLQGADHEHLMENPIYKRLYEHYEDAVRQVNLSRSQLRSRCEAYERRIRGYRENIQAMQREIETLREGEHA